MTHNYSTYTNRGCRCEVCREANRKHNYILRAGIKHGSSAYKAGCRCKVCVKYQRERAAVYRKEMKSRQLDCKHYKWRSNGPKCEICSRCGITRRKQLAVAA